MSVKRYGMTLLGFAVLVVLTFALAACGAAEEETTTAETTAAETTETESMDDSMASEDEMDDMDDESIGLRRRNDGRVRRLHGRERLD